jgi:CRISPR-associated protein Csb1
LQLSDLKDHLRRGGAAVLDHPATYAVAGGSVIAPARYAGRNGSEFVFETRFVDGEFRRTALIDSKQSQANRAEEGLREARREGAPASLIPSVVVRYPGDLELSDIDLPHRVLDSHVRAATQEGVAVVRRDWYRGLRDATHADLSPLFTASPATLVFGGWDSTRGKSQLRLRGLFVSELFGVVADREDRVSRRSGARLDPLGQDITLTPDDFEQLLDRQQHEMSAKTVAALRKKLEQARKKKLARMPASDLVLGGIPPSTEAPFGVSVPEVRRARTISLAGLRRLRFGGEPEDDVLARTALLAMVLLGVAHADATPDIRAYCDVTAPKARTFLDDEPVDLDLTIDSCRTFLGEAISALPARLEWTGQLQNLDGDAALAAGVDDGSDPE